MFSHKCLLRKTHVPLIPCDQKHCEWFINSEDCNNCFWIMLNILAEFPHGFSIEEIARFEGITEENVYTIIETAIKKARLNIGNFFENL